MIHGGEQVVQSMVTKCSGYQKETIAFISDIFGSIYLPKTPISFLSEILNYIPYHDYNPPLILAWFIKVNELQVNCGIFTPAYFVNWDGMVPTKIGHNFRK